MMMIADALRSLRTLRVDRVGRVAGEGMTDAVLARFVENCCATLVCIHLRHCRVITDVGAACLARCRELRDVDLWGCCCISGVGVRAVVEACRGIERLDVGGCLDDDLLMMIAQCCKTLTYFRTWSSRISGAVILRFVEDCLLLCDMGLDVDKCYEGVSSVTIDQINLICASRR